MPEILDLIKIGIEHQSWQMRIQASVALCTILNKLQSKIEHYHAEQILHILLLALNTRTWAGKVSDSCLADFVGLLKLI
jgi:hypothetical protein